MTSKKINLAQTEYSFIRKQTKTQYITFGYESLFKELKTNKTKLFELLHKIHVPVVVLYDLEYQKLELPIKVAYKKYSHNIKQIFHCGSHQHDIKYILDFAIVHKTFPVLYISLDNQDLLMYHLGVKMNHIDLAETSYLKIMELPQYLLPTKDEFNELWNLHPKEKGFVKMFGKLIQIPRWQQVFGNSYFYSGLYHQAIPMEPILIKFIEWCQKFDPDLNGCLVNWYDSGQSYIGAHSDNTEPLKRGSNIWTISLGATRKMLFEPKKNINSTKKEVSLTNGTVVIMGGTCQETHKHSIPKTPKKVISGKRISITFRAFKKIN